MISCMVPVTCRKEDDVVIDKAAAALQMQDKECRQLYAPGDRAELRATRCIHSHAEQQIAYMA